MRRRTDSMSVMGAFHPGGTSGGVWLEAHHVFAQEQQSACDVDGTQASPLDEPRDCLPGDPAQASGLGLGDQVVERQMG